MTNIITCCQELATHFKKCKLQNKLSNSLKQGIDTRWNNLLEILTTVDTVYDEILRIIAERKEEHLIEDIDIYLIRDVTVLLEPFKNDSEILSAYKEPSLHLVLPLVKKFKQVCEIKCARSKAIKQIKRALTAELDGKLSLSDLHYITTFLCLETKSLSVSLNLILLYL